MSVTKVGSEWVSGGLVFKPKEQDVIPTYMVQVGDSNGVDLAGGVTGFYSRIHQEVTAVTGTARGIRANCSGLFASPAGEFVGVDARVANGSSATATDGVSVGTLTGVKSLVAGVGTGTISLANAFYGQLDINAVNLTVSDARGLYINVQAQASGSTITLCNLMYLEYESVGGTAAAINSAIRISTVGGATGATSLVDATGFRLALTTTDRVTLMKFRDANGATVAMCYDISDNAIAWE